MGLHCCVYPAPHIHAAPDPCSTDSSGPTSQATCSAVPKCGSLGPPQRGGQPRRTNAGGWSTQPRRSHVGHSLMLCIPSAETAPNPCSMDHDTHNLKKKQVDTNHHVGLHCCVYPAPHIHAAPDPCSTDSSGPTSQATCSAAPKCGSLGPPQRGGQPRRTNAGGWSTQPRRSHVGHSLMLCIPSAETAPDPCSMDHDTHNLKKKQMDTPPCGSPLLCIPSATHTCSTRSLQHGFLRPYIPGNMQCSPKMWQPRTPAKRRSTAPHQCRGLVDTASQESCWSFPHAVYTQRRNSTKSLQHGS